MTEAEKHNYIQNAWQKALSTEWESKAWQQFLSGTIGLRVVFPRPFDSPIDMTATPSPDTVESDIAEFWVTGGGTLPNGEEWREVTGRCFGMELVVQTAPKLIGVLPK